MVFTMNYGFMSNNMVEFLALERGLMVALEVCTSKLQINEGSQLVIKTINKPCFHQLPIYCESTSSLAHTIPTSSKSSGVGEPKKVDAQVLTSHLIVLATLCSRMLIYCR